MPTADLEMRKLRLALSGGEIVRPLLLLLAAFAGYFGTEVIMLTSPLLVSIVFVPLCAFFVALLFVIGHDACHLSFTGSRRLNQVIGRMVFFPSLTSFSLWDQEHNRRHHRHNNVRQYDLDHAPMSPEEYAAASPSERRRYAFSRSAVGVPLYYMYKIWLLRLLLPRKSLVSRIRFEHYADAALLCGFLLGSSYVAAVIGGWFGKSAIESILLGVIGPFVVFDMMISVAIFVQHNHYFVPWYSSLDEWQQQRGSIYGTVHVSLPYVVDLILLNAMVHNAHHYAPGIPLYRLEEMQSEFQTPKVVHWTWSVRNFRRVCDRCKLFDYAKARWTDFSGASVTGPLLEKTARPEGRPLAIADA